MIDLPVKKRIKTARESISDSLSTALLPDGRSALRVAEAFGLSRAQVRNRLAQGKSLFDACSVSTAGAGFKGSIRRDLAAGVALDRREVTLCQAVERFRMASSAYLGVIFRSGDMRLILSRELWVTYALQRLQADGTWVTFACLCAAGQAVPAFLHRHGFVMDGVQIEEVDFDLRRMAEIVFGSLGRGELAQLRRPADDRALRSAAVHNVSH